MRSDTHSAASPVSPLQVLSETSRGAVSPGNMISVRLTYDNGACFFFSKLRPVLWLSDAQRLRAASAQCLGPWQLFHATRFVCGGATARALSLSLWFFTVVAVMYAGAKNTTLELDQSADVGMLKSIVAATLEVNDLSSLVLAGAPLPSDRPLERRDDHFPTNSTSLGSVHIVPGCHLYAGRVPPAEAPPTGACVYVCLCLCLCLCLCMHCIALRCC